MRLFQHIFGSIIGNASREIGTSIGNAIGNGIEQVGQEATKSITTDMKAQNKEKEIAIQRKELEFKEEEKAKNLPPTCPHCGAATEGTIVCRFCECKIVE